MPWHQTDSPQAIAIAPDSGVGQDGVTIAAILTVSVFRERLHQTPSCPGHTAHDYAAFNAALLLGVDAQRA
jgi:hypothetical protein